VEIPEVIEERRLCRGKRVALVQRVYRIGNDFVARDVVCFGQSVAVLAIKNNKVLLIKQFRPPIGRWIIEIPAGRVEPGEQPEQAAVRELREEVGYEPGRLTKISSVYPSPGYSDEVIHIYLATDLRYVGASPEAGELIEVIEVDMDRALDIVLSEGVADAKTVLALTLFRMLTT